MASRILISRGCTADAAMRVAKGQRPVAAPYVGYIQSRIRTFEHRWLAGAPGPPNRQTGTH